jgi:arrestin (S-antigen)-like protein
VGHQLSFEGLPDYSWPGGSIAGTLVLATDTPMRATDLELHLRGREISQITVQAGKNREALVDTYPFLDLVSSFKEAIPFTDADHIAAGTYRLPFQFDVPANGEPSLATTDRPAVRGRFDSRPDGMYVEYELEARVDVPWWVDPVDRVVVPVFSARRVLGSLPAIDSPVLEDHPSFHLQFDAPMILPGTDVTGSYVVNNPRAKELPGFVLRLYRHVEHQAKGRTAVRDGPEFATTIPLGGRESSYTGTFRIPLPNTANSTGPFHGQLYRTWWMGHFELEVSLGFDVRVEAAFNPT